jgi:hypothetical protein
MTLIKKFFAEFRLFHSEPRNGLFRDTGNSAKGTLFSKKKQKLFQVYYTKFFWGRSFDGNTILDPRVGSGI